MTNWVEAERERIEGEIERLRGELQTLYAHDTMFEAVEQLQVSLRRPLCPACAPPSLQPLCRFLVQ